ncbi:Transglutaminase [Apiospora sp. TS-2023a]
MSEKLALRTAVDTALPQVREDDLDKDLAESNERLAHLAALKAPTHHPEPDTEPDGSNFTQLYLSAIVIKDDIGLEVPTLKCEVSSASEEASFVARSSSPASETSHSKSADDSRNSGTSYMTTIPSTRTSGTSNSEGPYIRELEKGVLVAPRLPIPPDDVENWSSIKHRLEDTLLNLFKPKPGLDPSLSWELVMAGPCKAPLKPSIVITCCNEPHRKRLKKLLKSQKWLSSTGYPVIVVIDPVHQLSLVKRPSESTPTSHKGTSLGVGLGIGLGLATRHSFEYWNWKQYSSKEEPRFTGGPDTEQESESQSDSDSEDSQSTSAWVFMDGERDDDSNTLEASFPTRQLKDEVDCISSSSSISTPELPKPQPPTNELLREGRLIGTVKAPKVVASDYGPDNAKLDWAIIELNNTQCRAVNRVATEGSSCPWEITEVAETARLEDGEVTIVSGFTGVVKGWLRKTPVMLKMGCRTYEAYQIIIESHLVRGDSGAWVVKDGMFCGHIIAQKTFSPIAFMLPAQGILEDIKSCMGTNIVNLPNTSDQGL